MRAYPTPLIRAAAGFLAAGISVLTFHAAAWWVLHQFGLMPPPYPTNPPPPFGIPLFLSLTFWGALYGIPSGLLLPHLSRPLIPWGLALGLLACLVGWFVVAPLKGAPPASGSIIIPLIVNGSWGIGVSLLLPLLLPARLRRAA